MIDIRQDSGVRTSWLTSQGYLSRSSINSHRFLLNLFSMVEGLAGRSITWLEDVCIVGDVSTIRRYWV